MLSAAVQDMCNARPNEIDYDKIKDLHYLGNYVRRLPSNLTRMMENAYDWEHLPFVHASSFKSIALVDSGKWGWRAKLDLPDAAGGGEQVIDLLIDADNHYWATTVFSGVGEGVQVHTQATKISDDEIEVDVRFYFSEKPDDAFAEAGLAYLQQQYATLYDEDQELMTGRQTALEDAKRWRAAAKSAEEICVGTIDALSTQDTHIVETSKGRYCVRQWQGNWIAHSAVCPHLLGPLDDSAIDDDGQITCPWHGYKFDVESGKTCGTGDNVGATCRDLQIAPQPVARDGKLYLNL